MRCPACGIPLALALEVAVTNEGELTADPLAPVVRRLEAEQYGSAEPLPEDGTRQWWDGATP